MANRNVDCPILKDWLVIRVSYEDQTQRGIFKEPLCYGTCDTTFRE